MKKFFAFAILWLSAVSISLSQNVGISFSYFVPRNGDFSTPISPFSLRGIGVNLNKYMAIETGASLYRMSGMGLIDLPIESSKSLLGPNFTILVPVELVFQLPIGGLQFDVKGGGFFFYGFDQTLNYGNIDRAIKKLESWDVVNSNLTYENNPGFGIHAGVELTIPVTDQVSISLETNYLMGSANFPLKGNYTGGTMNGNIGQPIPVDYKDAKIDFTGLEFSIGLIFGSGGGKSRAKPKRRR